MKLKKAQNIVLSFFALVLVAFVIQTYIGRKNFQKFEKTTLQNCLQLRVGMTRDEVRAIMGEPKGTQDYEVNGVIREDWYFDAPLTVSEPPICGFDKEKGTLEYISCGEM